LRLPKHNDVIPKTMPTIGANKIPPKLNNKNTTAKKSGNLKDKVNNSNKKDTVGPTKPTIKELSGKAILGLVTLLLS